MQHVRLGEATDAQFYFLQREIDEQLARQGYLRAAEHATRSRLDVRADSSAAEMDRDAELQSIRNRLDELERNSALQSGPKAGVVLAAYQQQVIADLRAHAQKLEERREHEGAGADDRGKHREVLEGRLWSVGVLAASLVRQQEQLFQVLKEDGFEAVGWREARRALEETAGFLLDKISQATENLVMLQAVGVSGWNSEGVNGQASDVCARMSDGGMENRRSSL